MAAACIVLGLLPAAAAGATRSEVVKRINPGSHPAEITDAGGTAFFRAEGAGTGLELGWSDGTAAGTQILDLRPGPIGSSPGELTALGGVIFFRACDEAAGCELWRSDGTVAGTHIVEDIHPTASSSPSGLTAFDGELFFRANDGGGYRLWRSDGTAAGTEVVTSGTVFPHPARFAVSGGALFFAAQQFHGYELWRSDGTAAGTEMVIDIRGLGHSLPDQLTDVDGTLYFTADDGTGGGRELWRSDGTEAGTVKLDVPFSYVNPPQQLTALGDVLFFTLDRGGGSGDELWRTDGTLAGTQQIVVNPLGGSFPADLTVSGGRLFFSADGGVGGRELWASDGTVAGTQKVTEINALGSAVPEQLADVEGTLYFKADDGLHGPELWRSDGTAAGTAMVADTLLGAAGTSPTGLAAVGGAVFFSASDPSNGRELWRSDGTVAGTGLVHDLGGGGNSSPNGLIDFGGSLFFGANDGHHGSELWSSDGSDAGTSLFADLRPGLAGSGASPTLAVGGVLYFRATDGVTGSELWRTDGTAAGTELVHDINPGAGHSSPTAFVESDGMLFFSADDGTHGRELWRSDGTSAGTQMVADVEPGSGSSFPTGLVAFDGAVFFRAFSASTGYELWRTDGTAAGTEVLKDIRTGSGSSAPSSLTVSGGALFFRSFTPGTGYELWRSDGTEAGTELVDPSGPSNPVFLLDVAGTLYFRATSGTGAELWRSDGTEAGTELVKDINPSGHSFPSSLTDVGGELYFTADDGTTGAELWRSDGSEAGTELVKDINPGPDASTSTNLTLLGSALVFRADDGTHGSELWVSDGTEDGTALLDDIYEGAQGSSPFSLTVVGSTLFFRAHDEDVGTELWKFEPATTPPAEPTFTGTDPSSPADDASPRVLGTADGGSTVRLYASADCTGPPAAVGPAGDFASPGLEVTVADDSTTTFRATATDVFGTSSGCSSGSVVYVEDSTAPETTVESGPDGATNDAEPTFGFAADEAGSTFECSLVAAGDPAAFGACSGPGASHSPAAGLADGDYRFEVRATDQAGNTDGSAAGRDFTVDTVAPAEPSFSGTVPGSPANDNTPLVKGAASSTVDIYSSDDCSGAPEASGGSAEFADPGIEVTVADDSTTTFRATATDAAGNVSECSSDSIAYVEDSTAPETTVDSGPEGPTGEASPTFGFDADQADSTFECSLVADADPAAFGACSGPGATHTPPSELAEGAYTFEVRATDQAGNTDTSPATRSFTVDTTPPAEPTFTGTDPSSPADDASPLVLGTADGGSTVRLYASADCTGPPAAGGPAADFADPGLEVSVADDSETTFWATATDAAGNVSGCSSDSIAYVEDSTAPETTVESGPDGSTNDASPTFGFSADGPDVSFECRLYDRAGSAPAFGACSGPGESHSPAAALADGDYRFEVRATDQAGNTDGSAAGRDFTVDTVAPAEPSFDATVPGSPANDNAPLVKGAASSTVDIYSSDDCSGAPEASGDGAEFADPGIEVTVADDSETTFRATATDAAGNVSECSSDSIAYVEDSTAPETTIDSGPGGTTDDTTPSFGFSADEAGAGFECRLYSQGAAAPAFSACSGPGATHTPPSELADGAYTFEVRATDQAGNADASPATRDFTVELPEPTSDRPPAPPADPPPAQPQQRTPAPAGSRMLRRPAALQIYRARIANGRLFVSGSLHWAAAGKRVSVRFRTARRTIVRRPIVDWRGRFRVVHRLRGRQRRASAGRVVVRFAGGVVVRPSRERVRAARRPVRLRVRRVRVVGNRLLVAGRVARSARRRVRIEVRFSRASGAPARIVRRARVYRRGRFRARPRVPRAVLERGARVSVTHPGRGNLHGQRLGRNVRP